MLNESGARMLGMRIRQERLKRSWSQEGLCKGICAVSWLSKLEQGKAEASPQVLRLLLQRLELPWYGEQMAEWQALVERQYDSLFSGDWDAFSREKEQLANAMDRLTASPFGGDALVLWAAHQSDAGAVEPDVEACLDNRQLTVLRVLQDRDEEAIRLTPCAYCYTQAGIGAYERGSDGAAIGYLEQGYALASQEGYVHLMLTCKLFIGNCYCNRQELSHMETQYAVAARLARLLGKKEELRHIRYNTAAAQLEAGCYDLAYAYFGTVENPGMMELHKRAVCLEKLGRPAEALRVLDEAEALECAFPATDLALAMCRVARYRLTHADYLQDGRYGEMLQACFDRCRKELPVGYAAFHLPWLLQWLAANRQYKQAYELLLHFPAHVKW